MGHTTDARQILITDVAKGSPADGVLAKGDVVLGVGGKPFADDAPYPSEASAPQALASTRPGPPRYS